MLFACYIYFMVYDIEQGIRYGFETEIKRSIISPPHNMFLHILFHAMSYMPV